MAERYRELRTSTDNWQLDYWHLTTRRSSPNPEPSLPLAASDPDYEHRVRASFARQTFMATLGARMESVAPGEVVLTLPYRADLAQQHGFLHGGAVATAVDCACGYATMSLTPAGTAVLTVELKLNLLAPAAGERFRAVGRVVRAGRTLTVCTGELWAERAGAEPSLVAIMQTTMMTMRDRAGLAD